MGHELLQQMRKMAGSKVSVAAPHFQHPFKTLVCIGDIWLCRSLVNQLEVNGYKLAPGRDSNGRVLAGRL